MSYKVTFHTEAYKSHRASKKNWELGTQNDHSYIQIEKF